MDWKYEEGRIYSVDQNDALMAEVTYKHVDEKTVNIDHTYVNSSLRGQGVAGKIMKALADRLRESGLKAEASCSYAQEWLKRNSEEYADIIYDSGNEQFPACKIDGKH